MKKLVKFEVEAITDSIINQIANSKIKEFEKRYSRNLNDWNEEFKEIKEEEERYKEIIENKRDNLIKKIGIGKKEGLIYNHYSHDKISYIRIYNRNDFDFWKIKQSIMNEIIINNIKSENLDNIINELIKKYN
jgi:glutamyl-tRNA reductase